MKIDLTDTEGISIDTLEYAIKFLYKFRKNIKPILIKSDIPIELFNRVHSLIKINILKEEFLGNRYIYDGAEEFVISLTDIGSTISKKLPSAITWILNRVQFQNNIIL